MRVCLRDGFIHLELLDQNIRLSRVGPAKDRPSRSINISELIAVLLSTTEIGTITVVYERKDAAADRDTRSPSVTGLLPGCTKSTDLVGLLNVKRLTGFIELQCGRLKIHSELRRPDSCGVGSRTPPDALPQAFRVWLKPQQTGRIRKHRTRVGLSEAFAAEQFEKFLSVTAAHIRVSLAFRWIMAKMTPSLDHLLR